MQQQNTGHVSLIKDPQSQSRESLMCVTGVIKH